MCGFSQWQENIIKWFQRSWEDEQRTEFRKHTVWPLPTSHTVSFIISTVQKREIPLLSSPSYQETPSLLHARTTSGIPQTYMLCRAHQPQWGSPELRHSPQVVYCSHDSTGTLVTWQREEREHGKVRLWQLEGVLQNSPLSMPPRLFPSHCRLSLKRLESVWTVAQDCLILLEVERTSSSLLLLSTTVLVRAWQVPGKC